MGSEMCIRDRGGPEEGQSLLSDTFFKILEHCVAVSKLIPQMIM